ncbi:MAG: ClpXP protease specificity-enhancing factor SspB [Xanthobacteraceae bacterium]
MATDHIRYDILAQEALRGVVRTVLADAAEKGLPGEHHFKITFATVAPGVRLSERMRAQYPEAMTIVLQNQFWDLVVGNDDFEVGLSFGGVPERLAVPFAAITAFYDPAVQFGFQFETVEAEAAGGGAAPSATADQSPPQMRIVPPESAKSEPTKSDSAKSGVLPAPAAVKPSEPAPPSGGGDVVRLDRFRKK